MGGRGIPLQCIWGSSGLVSFFHVGGGGLFTNTPNETEIGRGSRPRVAINYL